MRLIQLIYSSVATDAFSVKDLPALAESSELKNGARDITGVLSYGSGQFLQLLEGEREVVSDLYRRITLDPRHKRLQLLGVRDIDHRTFGVWGMKLLEFSATGVLSRRQRAVLRKHTKSEEFDPSQLSGEEASRILADLGLALREAVSMEEEIF